MKSVSKGNCRGRRIRYLLLAALFVLLPCLSGCGGDEPSSYHYPEADTSLTVGDIEDQNNTDVVLVMDKSGSMVNADPDRFAIEGAKLFVDMEKISGVNVAVVEFSNEIRSTGLTQMQQPENKEYLKTVLDSIDYSGRSHTDTGAAMLEAVSILDGSDSVNDKAIILFTDGRTDIDAGTPGRTTEDSQLDTDAAVQMAAERGYTVYCIGLNSDGNVDEAELAKMTSATGGKYHIATNVDELRAFFNSIFADIDSTKEEMIDEYVADGDYHESTFTIENANVAEANIVILSSRQVEDVILTDQNGAEVDLNGGENVFFSNSATYSLVKLINPAVGTWKIRVRGVADDQIRIAMIYNFNFSLMVEVSETETVKDSTVTVKAWLASGGEVFEDSEFYRGMSGYVTVTDQKTGETWQEELTLNSAETAFYASLSAAEPGDYEVMAHLEGNGLFRDSDRFTIHVTKDPAVQIQPLPEIGIRLGETVELDLNDYFEDPDGGELIYAFHWPVDDPAVETELAGSKLTITGKQKGVAAITVSVDNGSADLWICTFLVSCSTLFDQIWPFLAVVALLAVAVLAVYLIRKSKERVEGTFKVSITSGQTDESGTVQLRNFDILNSIPTTSLGRKGFTMEKLLTSAQGYYAAMEFDQERREAFLSCTNEMKPEARKVKVCGSRNHFEIRVKNGSSIAKFFTLGTLSEKKLLILSIGDTKFGVGAVTEKEFGVRFVFGEEKYAQINIIYKRI